MGKRVRIEIEKLGFDYLAGQLPYDSRAEPRIDVCGDKKQSVTNEQEEKQEKKEKVQGVETEGGVGTDMVAFRET